MTTSLISINISLIRTISGVAIFVIAVVAGTFAFAVDSNELNDEFTTNVLRLIADKHFDGALHRINQEMENVKKDQHIKKANLFNLLAIIHSIRGNLDEAEKNYHKALEVYRKKVSSDTSFVAGIYNGLATVYKKRKEFQKFIFYNEKAINIYKAMGDARYTNCLLASVIDLAEYYRNEGELIKSEILYKSALDVLNKDRSKAPIIIQASIHKALGDIYTSRNDLESSKNSYLLALELLQGNFGGISGTNFGDDEFRTNFGDRLRNSEKGVSHWQLAIMTIIFRREHSCRHIRDSQSLGRCYFSIRGC